MKLLIVVDMQRDFIDGCLGTKEAQAVVEPIREKILRYRASGDMVIFTRDTHGEDYMNTQEGRNLPIPHCIKGSAGWGIHDRLPVEDSAVVDKPSFGSPALAHMVSGLENIESIELVGVCTDICVISNAMLLKAALPEVPVAVDSTCCAGVTPESHETALKAMTACQIQILP
ncbi:MAG: cysteine hydrolase [Ruminococcaceae bacterium]|nr:cysteine hydrolase [Oscillospiraceae bacterium]